MATTRLNEFDKTEWFDLARRMKPGLTEQQYDAMWQRFMEAKQAHELLRSVN